MVGRAWILIDLILQPWTVDDVIVTTGEYQSFVRYF
jgi:hypothetical protein